MPYFLDLSESLFQSFCPVTFLNTRKPFTLISYLGLTVDVDTWQGIPFVFTVPSATSV